MIAVNSDCKNKDIVLAVDDIIFMLMLFVCFSIVTGLRITTIRLSSGYRDCTSPSPISLLWCRQLVCSFFATLSYCCSLWLRHIPDICTLSDSVLIRSQIWLASGSIHAVHIRHKVYRREASHRTPAIGMLCPRHVLEFDDCIHVTNFMLQGCILRGQRGT